MSKRIIGLVLALCLIVGMLPVIALAEETAAVTSTLNIKTKATADGATVNWKPTLSEGMAPAYAKTTDAGVTTTDGASETDYNLKVEWPTGGKPTLTLNNAKFVNEYRARTHTINIGGTADFVIQLKGANYYYGNPTGGTTYASYGQFIMASNKGNLTITNAEENATLYCEVKGAAVVTKQYKELILDNTDVTVKLQNTGSNSQYGIIMQYTEAGYEDLNNLKVLDSKLDIEGTGNYVGVYAITMAGTSASRSSANTSDILFRNSDIRLYRYSGTSSTQATSALVWYGADSTFTIDRCDAVIYTRHITTPYVPTITNATATMKPESGEEVALPNETNTTGSALGKSTSITVTHTCSTVEDDFDCTTPNTCDKCGAAIGTAQTAHTPAADDGDCTTEVLCANEGCKKVVTAAAAAHTPAADDNDCTTDTVCTVCGKVTTPAPGHTPADRTSCDVAANCTVCGKEALKAGAHAGGTATCQAKAKCTECGQEYGELAPCAGGAATCTAKAKCATCGEEYGETAPHTGGTATCKDKAVCEVCSQPYGELSTEHIPGEDDKDCSTAVACTLCGGEAIAAKTHAFTNSQDTACDNVGCEHTRVVEPKPEFKISFATAKGGGTPSSTGKATLVMNAGDPTKYYITGNFDTTAPTDYFTKALTDEAKIAAGEWNIKIEYPADGIPTVTLRGAFIQNKGGIQFGGWNAPYEGPAKLIIETDSIINSGYGYKSTLRFLTKGQDDDVTITSVNNAKLTLISNTEAKAEGGIGATGNLTLDNANIEIIMTEYNGKANGINVAGGNLTIKGGSLKISAWDNASTTGTHKEGEEVNYLLNANAAYTGFHVTADAENAAKAGHVTIEGGAKVSIAVSVASNGVDSDKRVIATDGTFTIKDSEVEIALVGKCTDGSKLFSVKPTLEYTNNAYTVTATKTKKPAITTKAHELSTYAYIVETITPDESKLVDWAETTSMGSITYFKVVAGGSGGSSTGGSGTGTGTGTGSGTGSNPNTGDISILLTASIALASAVSFGGVTILRKKNG